MQDNFNMANSLKNELRKSLCKKTDVYFKVELNGRIIKETIFIFDSFEVFAGNYLRYSIECFLNSDQYVAKEFIKVEDCSYLIKVSELV